MALNNSNKNYSKIIAGILVISVLFILIATFIGCWGNSIYKQGGIQGVMGFPENSLFDTGRDNDEPIAQNGIHVDWMTDFTEDGSITYGNILIDDDDVDGPSSGDSIFDSALQFPLCLKETEEVSICGTTYKVLDWYMDAVVIGGYMPDGLSEIEIEQDKGKDYKIKIRWVKDPTYQKVCCNDERWIAIFYIPALDTEDKICLKSNYNPATGLYDLGKCVEVEFELKWKGCDQSYQKFEYILVQKSYISGVPNSRFIFIAS